MKVSAETGAAVKKIGYRPELDGIRALSAVAVVVHHWLWWEPGRWGVEVFFALSGFLITSILLEDVAATGGVRLGRFYVRRARRLVPCLLTVVAVCVVLLPLLQRGTDDGVLPALLYYSNWQRTAGVELGSLGHTWSLAIEEQFYLVWPLVVIACRRVPTRWMAGLCGATAVALLPHPGFSFLLAGAAIAYGRRAGWRLNLIVRPVTAVLSSGLLVWLGKRTYGLYLWHFPVGHILNDHTPRGLLSATAVTVLVVECSYRWIEAPFRSRDLHAPEVHAVGGGASRDRPGVVVPAEQLHVVTSR